MNKKLLLSFAVFATALSVNAQKRGQIKQVPHRSQLGAYEHIQESKVSSLNSDKVQYFNKRGAQTIVDTSNYFGTKRSYASPKTANISLMAYPSQAGDSTELATVYQIIPNTSNITLNGVRMNMVSLNKGAGSCGVDMKIYDMNTGATLAKASKTVLYSATQFGTYDFIFDKPYTTNDNILVSIEPQTENDTLLLPTSGGYRNSSIACNITGNQLTPVSPAPGTNIGTSFWSGQEVTGNGIPTGTKVIGYDVNTNTYTLSASATDGSNVVVSGVNLTFDDVQFNAGYMYLKFPTVSGSTTVPDFTKEPKQANDALIWINTGSWNYYDANLTMYPIVEYNYESTLDADNKCLGTSKTVNISYTNQDAFATAKNPLLNKMAFWTKYLGYSKANGYFYSRAYSSNDAALRDTIDNNSTSFAYKFELAADDMNDTITVYDLLLPYGYFMNPGVKGFTNKFLLSSKMNADGSVLAAAHGTEMDGKVTVAATGGFEPYTYAWTGSSETNDTIMVAVGDYTATVTDANGCTATSSSLKVELSSVAELGLTNVAVYPNPTKEVLNVRFDSKSAATVELVNVAGQVLDTKTSSNVTFNTSNLVSGIYFVNIKVAEGVYTQKIVKD